MSRRQGEAGALAAAATRDYGKLWERHFQRARRSGMSAGMAKYVADNEVKDQRFADLGRKPVRAGDYELIY